MHGRAAVPTLPVMSTDEPAPSAPGTGGLTKKILWAMLLGIAVGVVLNLLLRPGSEAGPLVPAGVAAFLDTFVIDGLFEIVGTVFIRLLQLLVVPLVFVSLVCGTASLGNPRKLGRVAAKTLGLYLFTTAAAITLAVVAALLIQPGSSLDLDVSQTSFEAREAPPLVQTLTNIVPTNPFAALASAEMLQVIFFALLLGLTLTVTGAPGERLRAFFEDANTVILRLVLFLIHAAPYGVFALLAQTFATQGFGAILPLFKYFALVLVVLLIHLAVVYPTLLVSLARLNPVRFLRRVRDVQVFAFSTASSNATIPVTLETVEHKLGVKNSVASFTVPLGATINMDGTAIMQGVATVFIAQATGIDIGLSGYLLVILTATLASIGTAGVPGVGLIMLSMVLTQVSLPVEPVALLYGIDRLLDMVRTAVNVTGDATVSCIVAKSEGEWDEAVYEQDN